MFGSLPLSNCHFDSVARQLPVRRRDNKAPLERGGSTEDGADGGLEGVDWVGGVDAKRCSIHDLLLNISKSRREAADSDSMRHPPNRPSGAWYAWIFRFCFWTFVVFVSLRLYTHTRVKSSGQGEDVCSCRVKAFFFFEVLWQCGWVVFVMQCHCVTESTIRGGCVHLGHPACGTPTPSCCSPTKNSPSHGPQGSPSAISLFIIDLFFIALSILGKIQRYYILLIYHTQHKYWDRLQSICAQ